MLDRRRHAPSGRHRGVHQSRAAKGLPQVYRGRARKTYSDIYDRDHNGGGFRWLMSTCLAAAVGALTIAVVIVGSLNQQPSFDSVIGQIAEAQRPAARPARRNADGAGLNWALPKTEQLRVATGALSARYTIHEQVAVRRNNQPFIEIRPYLRVVARLAPVGQASAERIPAFNPFDLYATKRGGQDGKKGENGQAQNGRVDFRIVELPNGVLAANDGERLSIEDVRALVRRIQLPETASTNLDNSMMTTGQLPSGLTPTYLTASTAGVPTFEHFDTNVTTIYKTVMQETESEETPQGEEVRIVKVGRGDSVARILQRLNAPTWLAGAMIEAANTIAPMDKIAPGQELHVRMVSSLAQPGTLEPAGFSVFDANQKHLVGVKRDDAGQFVATRELDSDALLQRLARGSRSGGSKSLYSSIFDAALTQDLEPEIVMKILRIHAYETDFRRTILQGDQVEWFFEMRRQTDGPPKLGELLYTAITTGGEKNSFWRYRTRDGAVEYYDERGHNSKKFLMRKPVRSSTVRLTSGFGFRRHPILKQRRMHTGVDWAGPSGTPILAAGKGVVEVAKRRGAYGNYVRIKHANGYQTAYAHMRRFGPGIRPGVKVKQGQVIGYIGSTGLSSGPHLHYEVLVNKRHVNPLKMKVPRERLLKGVELAEYKRERQRIDELMKRQPVETND